MNKIEALAKHQGFRRIALLIGGAGFGLGLILAIRSQPDLLHNIRWGPAILVIVLGVPSNMLANAFEFMLHGASMGRKIPFFSAVEISIISSAANMLPMPGGLATRVIALKSYNVQYRDGIAVNFLFAFIWIAVIFTFVGLCLLPYDIWFKWFFLSIGLITGIISIVWAKKREISFHIFTLAALQRLIMAFLGALKLWWCLLALGVSAEFGQAAVLVISGIIGSAMSIMPAGLGIREGVSAGLATIVGLSAASGFLAAAVNRILSLLILTPSAIIIGLMQDTKRSL